MEIIKAVRVPFEIEAVQVTEENILDVAKWCNGQIQTDPSGGPNGEPIIWIDVKVRNPLTQRQTKAYPSMGDWVLSSRRGFKVYTAKAFEENFNPVLGRIENVFNVTAPMNMVPGQLYRQGHFRPGNI